MSTTGSDERQSMQAVAEFVGELTARWGSPESFQDRRGSNHYLATYAAVAGDPEDALRGLGGRIDFAGDAPSALHGEQSMRFAAGHVPGRVSFLCEITPVGNGMHRVSLKISTLDPNVVPDVVPSMQFEAVVRLIGPRLYEDGYFGQFVIHVLQGAGNRPRLVADLAQIVADFLRDPDIVP